MKELLNYVLKYFVFNLKITNYVKISIYFLVNNELKK